MMLLCASPLRPARQTAGKQSFGTVEEFAHLLPPIADAVQDDTARVGDVLAPWSVGGAFSNFITRADKSGAYDLAAEGRLRALVARFDPDGIVTA